MKLALFLMCLAPVLAQIPNLPGLPGPPPDERPPAPAPQPRPPQQPPPPQPSPPAQPPAPPPESKFYDFEKAIGDFALDLHRAILRTKEKYDNIVMSPLSIVNVLNLMMAGSAGETYDELRRVLRYPPNLDDERINKKYRRMLRILLTPNRGVDVTLANRIFLHPTFFPSNYFINASNEYYFTGLETRDFTKPEVSRLRINAWVKEETRNEIDSLLTRPLSPLTRMVVANAVYFKGDWEFPFHKNFTSKQPFHISSSKSVQVYMMVGINDVPYVKMDKLGIQCKMIGLPYKTTNFGLFLILPDEKGIEGLEKLESRLNADRIIEMIFNMKRKTVNIKLPRMQENQHASMVDSLTNLGLNTLFDPKRVNLRRINARGDLTFNDCVHQAKIDINEEGTTAAAATILTSSRGGVGLEFTANRPFLYFIRDNITGTILFWGRQVWPTLQAPN